LRAHGQLDEQAIACSVDTDGSWPWQACKEAPVGFSSIRMAFNLDTAATAEQVQTLISLTERYCVIYQTLARPPRLAMTSGPAPGS
jgi:uncharacterized OsmC-like protein